MSKSGSSTQNGSPIPGGGCANRGGNRGARPSRAATLRRRRASVGPRHLGGDRQRGAPRHVHMGVRGLQPEKGPVDRREPLGHAGGSSALAASPSSDGCRKFGGSGSTPGRSTQ